MRPIAEWMARLMARPATAAERESVYYRTLHPEASVFALKPDALHQSIELIQAEELNAKFSDPLLAA